MPVNSDLKVEERREIMDWCKDCAKNACNDWTEGMICRHCLWVMLRRTSAKKCAFNSRFVTTKPQWWKPKPIVPAGNVHLVSDEEMDRLKEVHPDEVCECQRKE